MFIIFIYMYIFFGSLKFKERVDGQFARDSIVHLL